MAKRFIEKYADEFILTLALAGFMFSHALMSFSLAFMALRFVFAGKARLKCVRKDVFAALLSFFCLFLIGALWSENTKEAFSQINKMLPFLVVPLYFFTIPNLKAESLKRLAVIGLLLTGICCAAVLFRLYVLESEDVRQAMLFGSHIRFALLCCIAIGFYTIYVIRNRTTLSRRVLLVFPFFIAFFICYLLLSGSITGIMMLLVVLLPLCLWQAGKRISKRALCVLASSLAVCVLAVCITLLAWARDYFIPKNGAMQDAMIENGSYLAPYGSAQWEKETLELASLLPERLGIAPDSLFHDKNASYPYVDIVWRYLNSKNLSRDAAGLACLDAKDLDNIRKGIPNHVYAGGNPLKVRIYKTFYEFEAFKHGGKIEGSSLVQRTELWHKGILLLENRGVWIAGVGTGDLVGELDNCLRENNSPLAESGLKIHNQYLTIVLTFGIVGFLVFCVFIFYPPFATGLERNAYYVCFLAVMLLSMLTEDTLDNQQGIMLFAILNSFFLSRSSKATKKT